MFVIFVSGCSTLPSRQMFISFLRWSSPSFSLCFRHRSLFLSFQNLRLPAVSLQACYDSKPRIISKRFQDDQTICSNLDVRHNFDANKWVCLQHTGHYKSLFSHPLSLLILHQLFAPYAFSSVSITLSFSLCAHQVLGFRGEDPQCDLQEGSPVEHPVSHGSVQPSHPVRLCQRGQLPLRPLCYRAQNLEGAERNRCLTNTLLYCCHSTVNYWDQT